MTTNKVQCQDAARDFSTMLKAAAELKAIHKGKATSENRIALIEARRNFHDAAGKVVRLFLIAKLKELEAKSRDLEIEYNLAVSDESDQMDAEEYMEYQGQLESIRERVDELEEVERHYIEKFGEYI